MARGQRRPTINNTWQCVQCRQWLPFESFGRNKRSSSGFDFICKECRAQRRIADQQRYRRMVDGERLIEIITDMMNELLVVYDTQNRTLKGAAKRAKRRTADRMPPEFLDALKREIVVENEE